MSILDSPDAASVVSSDDIRHFEEQVVVYEQDIAAVLAEIEKLREEEEDNAKLFSSEIDKFIDDIRKCRQEIQDEIVHTGDVVQRDRDGMLQSCDEELEVIKEKLEVMKEMHDERVHEIIEGSFLVLRLLDARSPAAVSYYLYYVHLYFFIMTYIQLLQF